jgi:hypothetical protein
MGFGVCKINLKQKRLATGPQAKYSPTSSWLRVGVLAVVVTAVAVVVALVVIELLLERLAAVLLLKAC